MRILLVTSWGVACGISDYAASLKQAVETADPTIEILPDPVTLDPYEVRRRYCFTRGSAELHYDASADPQYQRRVPIDLIHLNHHDALHSRWTAAHVAEFTKVGMPIVVTYHDTRERVEDCPKLVALAQVASSTIVHEPVEGLPAIYWRQGVPAASQNPHQYYTKGSQVIYGYSTPTGMIRVECFKAFPQQPVLGTVGFNFPWKCYDRLCQLTADLGWALVLLSNNATEEDEARWRAMNSSILVIRKFLPQVEAVNYLAGCDATAFMYECANTGTSGAIRLGIAARKPVIALKTCRQFTDLQKPDGARGGVRWADDWEDVARLLHTIRPTAFDPLTSALAHRDSWTQRGKDHAQLYHLLVEGPPA